MPGSAPNRPDAGERPSFWRAFPGVQVQTGGMGGVRSKITGYTLGTPMLHDPVRDPDIAAVAVRMMRFLDHTRKSVNQGEERLGLTITTYDWAWSLEWSYMDEIERGTTQWDAPIPFTKRRMRIAANSPYGRRDRT